MPETQTTLLDRLSAAAKPGETWDLLVLAALDGADALAAALSEEPKRKSPSEPRKEPEPQKPEPAGAYLKSIAVEGFRGIGPQAVLELPPGPGLTLVVGRNGSGKSSFAEALELLLTGDTFRWAHRTKVWREGWRNLHHPKAHVQAEFALEGERGSCKVWREWPEGSGDVKAAPTEVQIHGKPKTGPEALGWEAALASYRPFLSYNELGSMDEGPSKLYDALSAILGLDDLVAAQEVLKDARTPREKAQKEAGELRKQIGEPAALRCAHALPRLGHRSFKHGILARAEGEGTREAAELVDHLGKPAPETRHHILAIERVVRAELSNLGQGPVDGRGALLRIDHPDEPNAGLKVLADLVQHVARPIVRREHLDGEIGWEVGESLRGPLAGKPPRGHEADVGDTDVSARKPEAGAGVGHMPEVPLFHEGVEERDEPDANSSVTIARRAHANPPVDELVLLPVLGRAEEILFRGCWSGRGRHSRAPGEEKNSTDIRTDPRLACGRIGSVWRADVDTGRLPCRGSAVEWTREP